MNEHSPLAPSTLTPLPGQVARRTVDGAVMEWVTPPPLAKLLELAPHPEGGWFRRTWTGSATVRTERGDRAGASLIYFYLPPGEASLWHRVASDELWLWHGPGTISLQRGGFEELPEPGRTETLGGDVLLGQHPQLLVCAGEWQRTLPATTDCLVSCLVSPGFDFADWEQLNEFAAADD